VLVARYDDLPTVGDAHEPRRAIQLAAVVVTVAVLRLAGVHTHTHPQRTRCIERLRNQRELRRHRRT
jgi:hypothetical protein